MNILVSLQIKFTTMQEIKNTTTYKESLKEKILSAAMSLFIEKGIKAVKMDDIANSLSISKRTIYEICENKEDLLFEGVKRQHIARQDVMREFAAVADNVMDIILHSFRLTIEQLSNSNIPTLCFTPTCCAIRKF